GQPQDTDTVDVSRAQCQARRPADSIDKGNTMANHQRQSVTDAQVQRIHAELRSRRATVAQEHPPWTTSLPPTDSPNYQDTLNKVLLWRAVADYQQPEHPTAPHHAPTKSNTTRPDCHQPKQTSKPAATGPQTTHNRHTKSLH